MHVIILYRPRSEHGRKVEAFVYEFQKVHSESTLELVDADTADGARKAEVYQVMEYPAVMALSSDGRVVNSWAGEMLPLMNELAYYANS